MCDPNNNPDGFEITSILVPNKIVYVQPQALAVPNVNSVNIFLAILYHNHQEYL